MRVAPSAGTLFIDTNLLVLLIVGAVDVEQVERFNRTRAYTREDYALLTVFAARFPRMLTTPNVLTEASNLLGQLREPLRGTALRVLAALIGELRENMIPSVRLVGDALFPALGLADTSIIHSVQEGVTVLTDDLTLYSRLSATGVDAINFNHVRTGSWS